MSTSFKNRIDVLDVKKLQGSIVLIQGQFADDAFDLFVEKGIKQVHILEGRPSLESAKNSSKQCIKRGIKPIVIADNMAGILFFKGLVKEVYVAYQSLAGNKAVCHIGAQILAILAKKHKVDVIALPACELKPLLGHPKELLSFNGEKIAASGTKAYVPLVESVGKKYFKRIQPLFTLI